MNFALRFTNHEPRTTSHEKKQMMEILRKQFRPEFLNRIDDIVIFNPLTSEDLSRIVELQVERSQARLAERHVKLILTNRVKAFLAREGFDSNYGARPLRRAVQTYLMNPLALRLLDGSLKDGQSVTVDLNGASELSFKPDHPAGV